MFTEAIEDILKDTCTPDVVRSIEHGGSAAPLWDALAAAGFLELMAPEAAGGAGLALDAVFPIFASFGRYAVPVPVAQSIAARAILSPSAMTAPSGMITLSGKCRRSDDGSIHAPMSPFGMFADYALANLDGALLLLDCAQAERIPTGVRGSLCATLRWASASIPEPIAGTGDSVHLFSAAIHAAAIAGAMERVFGMTLEYCNDRSQFGKTIGKFQAVQHQLSIMAQHVASAGIAAELAFPASINTPARLVTAIAKSRTSTAVPIVASIAHALHGAIGITEEYDLQLYTRRLHEWRMADGAETYWNRAVGEALFSSGQTSVTDFVRAAISPPPA
jgi:alkylation response protein AidB-like acyl-CoA dehydrogenase